MGKKLWALALVGAAAYLYKTKKGAEIRKQVADYAGKAMHSVRESTVRLLASSRIALTRSLLNLYHLQRLFKWMASFYAARKYFPFSFGNRYQKI